MANVTIGDLSQATSFSRDDLVETEQEINGNPASRKMSLGEVVRGGFLDFTNISVAVADWTLQANPDFAGYPYVADITATDVTSNDVAEVIPSLAAINDGKLCPLNMTGTDSVKIYASSVPSSAYTIERISVRACNAGGNL